MAREIDENPDNKGVTFVNGLPKTHVRCPDCDEVLKVSDREDHDCN